MSDWQPIESAPTSGEPILLYWRYAGWMRGRFVNDERGSGWMNDGDMVLPKNQRDCTQWMPLPPPPGGER